MTDHELKLALGDLQREMREFTGYAPPPEVDFIDYQPPISEQSILSVPCQCECGWRGTVGSVDDSDSNGDLLCNQCGKVLLTQPANSALRGG